MAAPALSRWRPSPRRFVQLLVGLYVFGAGEAFLVSAELGNSPWTVFAEGVEAQTALSIGAATVLLSGIVLLLWIPLRQRPGLGTVMNAVLVGVSIDVTLAWLPEAGPLAVEVAYVFAGIALVGIGSGLYLTSWLGPGPRDGLMTGLHERTGRSIRLVRTGIEVTAVAIGIALGGTAGFGTVAFALLIGPAVQLALGVLGERRRVRGDAAAA